METWVARRLWLVWLLIGGLAAVTYPLLPENTYVANFGFELIGLTSVTMVLIGRTVSVSSFTPIFILYSAIPMTAFLLVCLLIKRLGEVRQIS